MPIYEYACRSCGHEFETLVRSSETPACASCDSKDLEKKLSVFSAQGGASSDPAPSPCGSCGNPNGPGACRFN